MFALILPMGGGFDPVHPWLPGFPGGGGTLPADPAHPWLPGHPHPWPPFPPFPQPPILSNLPAPGEPGHPWLPGTLPPPNSPGSPGHVPEPPMFVLPTGFVWGFSPHHGWVAIVLPGTPHPTP